MDFSCRSAFRERWGRLDMVQAGKRAARLGIEDWRLQISDGGRSARLSPFRSLVEGNGGETSFAPRAKTANHYDGCG